MVTSAQLSLTARRNAPFSEQYQALDGLTPKNLSGYAFAMQVRMYGGAAGGPNISLATVGGASQGIGIDDAAAGLFTIRIDQASLAALPGLNQPEAGSPQRFSYDLIATPPGGPPQTWLEGEFVLLPGVTV